MYARRLNLVRNRGLDRVRVRVWGRVEFELGIGSVAIRPPPHAAPGLTHRKVNEKYKKAIHLGVSGKVRARIRVRIRVISRVRVRKAAHLIVAFIPTAITTACVPRGNPPQLDLRIRVKVRARVRTSASQTFIWSGTTAPFALS